MAINKVIFGNDTLIDITDTTATAGNIVSGYTAYGANGVKMTGSFDPSIYVEKAGDTMTGPLALSMATPRIAFSKTDQLGPGSISYIRANNSDENYFVFTQRKNGSSHPEQFNLPAPDAQPSSIQTYDILTSKNPVTIAQGGTGANTKAGAKTALDIDALEALLGGVKLIKTTVSANNGTVDFIFSGTCAFSVFSSGADATIRQHTHGYCTSTGTVSETKNPSGATGVTFTNASYKLTVKNTSQYTMFMILIAYGNPDNVSLQ